MASLSSIEVTFEEDPVVISTGNNGYINLNIRSVGSGTIEGIHVTATISDYPSITYEGDWEKSLGDLYSGSELTSLFQFQVNSSAKAGLYEAKFKISTSNYLYFFGFRFVFNFCMDIAKLS